MDRNTKRQQDEQNAALKKARQDAEKHVTFGDHVILVRKLEKALTSISKTLNEASVRIEALLKTQIDDEAMLHGGPDLQWQPQGKKVPTFDDRYRRNLGNLRIVQQFVTDVLGDQRKPFVDRVRAAVAFNRTQGDEFRVKDDYFPVRLWLGQNPDGLSGEEIAEIAESFGFPRAEVLRILVDERVQDYSRRIKKAA